MKEDIGSCLQRLKCPWLVADSATVASGGILFCLQHAEPVKHISVMKRISCKV